jgi:predicted AAA+ superfamily ATPase
MNLIERKTDLTQIRSILRIFPVVAILGKRQCGKTTIAKSFEFNHYFDLESPRDLAALDQPQLALEDLEGLIVIDEIQRKPNLFPLLRHLVDNLASQRYLILGSASRDLIRQSSETLAGRIGYFNLDGFRIDDVGSNEIVKLWLRGGLPRSFLAANDEESAVWRENYIATFLERDLPQLGISIPANTLRRFWTMLGHYHGQIINYSELARNFGISDMTARKYIELLEGTFMLRVLQPWHVNIGKRLVKRPKLHFTDPGIFHSLLAVGRREELLTHPKLGASWEGFALECVVRSIGKRNEEVFFWRTHSGAEVDLFWQHQGQSWAVEFKYMDAPRKSAAMQSALEDLGLAHLWVVYPGPRRYRLADNITALPLSDMTDPWSYPSL